MPLSDSVIFQWLFREPDVMRIVRIKGDHPDDLDD